MRKVIVIIFVSTLLATVLAVPSLYAFTFRPQWVPQTQFAGYYMAHKQGLYKDLGIDVEIKDGGPGLVGIQEVIAGETDFATGWLISAVQFRAKGQKLVLIGQMFQKSALLLVAKKAKGIETVKDFSGKTMGVWPADFQIPPKALIRKYRIGNVKVVPQGFTVEPFLDDSIDIASAMRYNEYFQFLESGLTEDDLKVFDYADLGMNIPEDGIYVHEDFFNKNTDVCRKFLEASLQGWRYAFAHKDETVKYLTELANKTEFKTTPAKQMWMLNTVEKMLDVSNTELKEKDFQTVIEVLKAARIIRKDLNYQEFYKKLP